MERLFNHIRRQCGGHLPYEEAVQLMLWLYCSVELLPEKFRDLPLSRENLAFLFSKLSSRGIISLPEDLRSGLPEPLHHRPGTSDASEPDHWEGHIWRLLRKKVELDDSFPVRAHLYL